MNIFFIHSRTTDRNCKPNWYLWKFNGAQSVKLNWQNKKTKHKFGCDWFFFLMFIFYTNKIFKQILFNELNISFPLNLSIFQNSWMTHFPQYGTAWKVSKYGIFAGPYFPAFGPEITPYLDTFHTVWLKVTKRIYCVSYI